MGPYAGVLPWAWCALAFLPPEYVAARYPTARGHEAVRVDLLGQERDEPGWAESGMWSDFGGGVERDVDADELSAAARECYEETSGMLGSRAEIEHRLREADARGVLERVRSPKGGVIFLLQVPFDAALPVHFERAHDYAVEAGSRLPQAAHKIGGERGKGGARRRKPGVFPPKGYYEKKAIIWVPRDLLAECVAAALPGACARAQSSSREPPNARHMVEPTEARVLRDDFVRTMASYPPLSLSPH